MKKIISILSIAMFGLVLALGLNQFGLSLANSIALGAT
jgi:hypothetical protein